MKIWHVFFFTYAVWICGIIQSFYYFTNEKGREELKKSLRRKSKIDGLFAFWLITSILAVGLFFPLLILGPLLLVEVANAPTWAGLISGGLAVFGVFLTFKMDSGFGG
jgi:hypothetical protein